MSNDDNQLGELFQRYREACPEVEPGPNFMPQLWAKIEGPRGFWFTFERLARLTATASAGLCLVLLVLNFVFASSVHLSNSTYTDALAADHSGDDTYYAETISGESLPDGVVAPQSSSR